MHLKNITAVPLPCGNTIKLTWKNPDDVVYPKVRIVRREGTFPIKPDPAIQREGVVLPESDIYFEKDKQGDTVYCIEDNNLQAETVYYYSFYPYNGVPGAYIEDIHNRAAAIATGKYNMSGQMYDLLPRIYYRYDTVLGKHGEVSPEDESKGQLRRFLDITGNKLDQLYSYAKALLDLYNLVNVDGRLLPILAQWIGWKTNYRREIDTQRNEIRNAPFIYQRIGLVPTIEATVKRLIGWESRTKEFVHNVLISNNPEKLTLWMKKQKESTWPDDGDLLSVDWSFEGRPAIACGSGNDIRLFYHTLRNDCWNILSKKFIAFNIDLGVFPELETELDSLIISSNLRQCFEDKGFLLSSQAIVNKETGRWVIKDFQTYAVEKRTNELNVSTWKQSEPLTEGKGFNKHPAAVFHEDKFWVFWDSFDEVEKKWHIQCRTSENDNWIMYNDIPDNGQERKSPCSIIDGNKNLWLFWLEKNGDLWQFKYSAHNISWTPIEIFPADSGSKDPRVEADPFVLFYPYDQSIWVFWARQEVIGGTEQKRWKIFYRRKALSGNWDDFQYLEIPTGNYDDREPSAFINRDGKIELYWSSKRDGVWLIWNSIYDDASGKWSVAKEITEGLYSQRDPLPVSINDNVILIYRSNQSIAYPSKVYEATKTVDFRYSGSTSYDADNLLKKELREQFEDFQTYTYDTGKSDKDWYARDTAGVFLTPGTDDQTLIDSNVDTIKNLLREFLPIQIRPVFFIETPLYKEVVYTKDQPGEKFFDSISESISEQKYNPIGYSRVDTVPEWTWMYTADCVNEKYFDHRTVNFNESPISTRFRTWHTGLTEEEVLWT